MGRRILGRAPVLTGLPGRDVSGVNGGVGRCSGDRARTCNCGGGGGAGDRDVCAGASGRAVRVLALAVESGVSNDDCAAMCALSKAAPGEAR